MSEYKGRAIQKLPKADVLKDIIKNTAKPKILIPKEKGRVGLDNAEVPNENDSIKGGKDRI